MWQLSLLNYIGFPPTYAFFFRTKLSMIYMKCFSIQHMTCFPMLSLSLPMTWLHLSYPIYIIWIFCMPCFSFRICYDGTSSMHMLFFQEQICHMNEMTTLMKWLHEWNDYMNEMTTWMKWLYLSSMDMLFFQE